MASLVKNRVIETNNGICTCTEIGHVFGFRWSAHQWWKEELYEKFATALIIPSFHPPYAGSEEKAMQNRLDFCDEMIKKYGG